MTTTTDQRPVEHVVIIGSGPAGYTAALYAARADLTPTVIEGDLWGGLLQDTTEVENYPGFNGGILGPELMVNMREQAIRFGATLITAQASAVSLATTAGELHQVTVEGEPELFARTVILATGAQHRKIGAPGEEALSGRGVSYCATCDAAFYRGQHTAVIGGGDSAMEEAIFLAGFAESVTIVNRRSTFRASEVMLRRARATPNIRWAPDRVVNEFAAAGAGLGHLVLRNPATEETEELSVTGAFVAVGHTPQSDLFRGQVPLDDAGYVVTVGKSAAIGVPGVFAAGDLVDHTYRQAITAAGSGCQAALEAGWYLRDNAQGMDTHTGGRVLGGSTSRMRE